MTFAEAIKSGFHNYGCQLVYPSNRAPRSEYWFWTLFTVLISIVFSILDYFIFPNLIVSPLDTIVNLALLLPSFGMSIRRLHDLNRNGWWALIAFTIIGIILLIVWFCMRGTVGSNRFGPDPLEGKVL